MDFWTYQENARSNSFRLMLLYAILVLGFSLLAAFIIDFVWAEFYPVGKGAPEDEFLTLFRFPLIAAAIPMLVGLMTLFAPASLSSGGRSVAEAMKGVLIAPQTTDSGERRLLNVVEEMALASNMPVPPVYVLKNEEGINAFAAGATLNDAVIGVTQGTVTYLNRSELQAVIAHEFSHILNGDMRLNLRFAQLLFGLMCLSEAGRVIMRGLDGGSSRSRRDSKGAGLIVVIALVCYFAGLLMAFLGRIVQAAVNRQREYLADASSVQFTRSNALAEALKKIGGLSQGSRLTETALAGNYSHFFFSQADTNLLSTHPSLKKRILRLDPSWDGVYPIPAPVREDTPAEARAGSLPGQARAETDAFHRGMRVPSGAKEAPAQAGHGRSPLGAALAALGQGTPLTAQGFRPVSGATEFADLPATAVLNLKPTAEDQALAKLRAACREPLDACHLIFALLLYNTPNVRANQLATVADEDNRNTILEYRQAVDLVPREEYLPLIELAVPALKTLSAGQYAVFHTALRRYIEADAVFSFKEWILYQLICSQVGAQYAPAPAGRPVYLRTRDASISLLAALAWLEPVRQAAEDAFAAGLRAMSLPTRALPEKPDPEILIRSMAVLRQSSEALRDNFISGAVSLVAYDNKLTTEEAMFMRLVSLCLARPLPKLDVSS